MKRENFPTPAFLRDLAAVVTHSGPVAALVLIDDETAAGEAAAARWLDHLPGCVAHLAAPEAALPAVRAWAVAARPGVMPVTFPGWRMGDWAGVVSRLAALDPPPRIIVSCAPYDAYGVLVKRPLETAVAELVGRIPALYLALDEAYGTMRVLDSRLLRDRLHARPRRLRAYRLVVRAVFTLASLLARLPGQRAAGWRRVP
ncbi:MAG: hypothetical protein IPP91_07310 [Betaproteobacteria bacterium]|nr:hypothetical protein [Betaproteobacteria bacterium]